MNTDIYGVITTIQQPTECVRKLAGLLQRNQAHLIIVGDRKGPQTYEVENSRLLSHAEQGDLGFKLAQLLPDNHYARKNLGYLYAIRNGAATIYETDDDNFPNEKWQIRQLTSRVKTISSGTWFNVYTLFSHKKVWPRGFPLSLITQENPSEVAIQPDELKSSPIQQGLADNSPDVDAIWRLIYNESLYFEDAPSVLLLPGTWCPFNSQNTWWWPTAYPLLYLPSYCSFRMTDIWRSFVAQRCLWELGCGVVFHGADVTQDRNIHDLMKDFRDEIPGYEHNLEIAQNLLDLHLKSGEAAVGENLRQCYGMLVEKNYMPEKELPLVDAWLEDLSAVNLVKQLS